MNVQTNIHVCDYIQNSPPGQDQYSEIFSVILSVTNLPSSVQCRKDYTRSSDSMALIKFNNLYIFTEVKSGFLNGFPLSTGQIENFYISNFFL